MNSNDYFFERVIENNNNNNHQIKHRVINFTNENQAEYTVGRHAQCDKVIEGSKAISRFHCRVSFQNSKIFIEDLSKNSNGTYLNGDRILQKTEVEVGDLIGLGVNPMIKVENPENERFIYTCCLPDQIEVLDSDEEIENIPEINQVQSIPDAGSKELPTVSSPDFSSDASTTSYKEVINRALMTLQSVDTDTSMISDDEKLKQPVKIVLERLPLSVIEKYNSKREERIETKEKKTKTIKEDEPKIANIDSNRFFSRTKLETVEKTKIIKRRLSTFVDPDTDDDDDDEEEAHHSKTEKKPFPSSKRKVSDYGESSRKTQNNGDTFDNVHINKKPRQSLPKLKNFPPKASSSSIPKVNSMARSSSLVKSSSPSSPLPASIKSPSTSEQAKTKEPPMIKSILKQPKNERFQRTYSTKEKKIEKFAFPSTSTDNEVKNVGNNNTNNIKTRRHTTHESCILPPKIVYRRPTILLENVPKRNLSRLKSVSERPTVSAEKREKLKELALRKKDEMEPQKPIAKAPLKVKITPENRGHHLMQEIPKPRSVTNKKVGGKSSPAITENSAVDSFRTKFLNEAKSTEINEVVSEEDILRNIEIPPPENDSIFKVNYYNDNQASQQMQLEDFPAVQLLSELLNVVNVEETDESAKKTLKSCLKSSTAKKSGKKKVRFVDGVGLVQSFSSTLLSVATTKLLKEVEFRVYEKILSWHSLLSPSEDWLKKPMKMSYENLNEYRERIKSLANVDLYTKLKNSERNNSVEFKFTVTNKKVVANHVQLELSAHNNPKFFYRGLMVIIKIKDSNKECTFYGYVSEIKGQDFAQSALVEVCHSLPPNLSVVKCKSLMYIRNEIKSMVAIENLCNTPLMQHILKPEINILVANWNTNLKITSKLSEEQKNVVNILTSEFLNRRKLENILALHSKAGTGKTKVLIEAIVSIIKYSKIDNSNPVSILVCALSNSCVDLIADQVNKTLNSRYKIRLGRLGEKSSPAVQSIHISEAGIKNCDVIFTTVSSAYEIYNHKKDFDVCFIDDAHCCMDIDLVVLLQLNLTKIFLFGDINLQQPMAQSEHLLDMNYDETFFARMIKTFQELDVPGDQKPILNLTTQFRMVEGLSRITDEFIYNSVTPHQAPTSSHHDVTLKPFLLLSYVTVDLVTFCKILNAKIKDIAKRPLTIGVVVRWNEKMESEKKKISQHGCQLLSVDRLQGVEKDVILIHIKDKSDIAYFSALNRFNGALSRGCLATYILVDIQLICTSIMSSSSIEGFGNNDFWNKIIRHAETNKLIKTITEHNLHSIEFSSK